MVERMQEEDMKKVYTDNSVVRCDLMRSLFEQNGIECFMKNETMSAMFGGGGYNPHQAYPELWVDEADVERATELVNSQAEEDDTADVEIGESIQKVDPFN